VTVADWTLKSVNNEFVEVERTGQTFLSTGQSGDPRSDDFPVPATVTLEELRWPRGDSVWSYRAPVTRTSSGTDTVDAGGRKLTCRWISRDFDRGMNTTVTRTIWISEEVPGGIVRDVEEMTTPGKTLRMEMTAISFEGEPAAGTPGAFYASLEAVFGPLKYEIAGTPIPDAGSSAPAPVAASTSSGASEPAPEVSTRAPTPPRFERFRDPKRSGTLHYRGAPVAEGGEVVFEGLPAGSLGLSYNKLLWEGQLVPEAGGKQQLILRSKTKRPQTSVRVVWRLLE
jgi:hypothetical protein